LTTNMLLLWMLALQLSCLTMAIPSTQGVLSQEGKSRKPPRERFERSIPWEEEKMIELLDNFKTEMLRKFQEQEQKSAEQEERILTQEEKNVEQDVKIGRQSETISQLEETIAEQNQMIQMIAKHLDFGNFLQGFKTGASPGKPLDPTTTATTTKTTTIGTLLEDSLLFITGGDKGYSFLSSTEVYPSTSGCSPPPLPSGRNAHTTFVTSEPSPLVATCGGYVGSYTTSCLVLDPINQHWDESRMGNLAMVRHYSAATTLNNIGVFIVGGYRANTRGTSEFLATGTMQWQEGPALPVDMIYPCAVAITPTSFLAIYGPDIREFDTAIAGPTNSEGWREAGRWPLRKTHHPGCAKIGQKVIIAGGRNEKGLSSTEVLNLVDRRISSGGELSLPRRLFHVGTIISGGEEKMFALAGSTFALDGSTYLNTVEEWVEANSTWKAADSLVQERRSFGAVAVPRRLICPL